MTLELSSWIKGAVLGFSIAAPVGPIGALCIRRTLTDGRLVGLATGLGAAAADGLYGTLAALGLTAVTQALVGAERIVRAVGGVLLLVMGWRTWTASTAPREIVSSAGGVASAFGSTFLLTITNPMTIVAFLAVFAGLGIGSTAGRPLAAVLLVTGVVMGSAAWWFLLSGGVSLVRTRFDERSLGWVNRISGGVIIAFGIAALVTAVAGRAH